MRKLPWLTEGSIDFIENFLINKDKKILEFGEGSSTLWFSDKCSKIISIEHNEVWFN